MIRLLCDTLPATEAARASEEGRESNRFQQQQLMWSLMAGGSQRTHTSHARHITAAEKNTQNGGG